MIEDDGGNTKEIDLNSESFKQSFIIQAPVVFNRVAMRQSITRNIALVPEMNVFRPVFKLEKAEDFRITKISVFPHTYLNGNSELKKLDLIITIEYNLIFTDGTNKIMQPDKAIFNLVLDDTNYPDSKVKYFEQKHANTPIDMNNKNKAGIKVEALAETFGVVLCPCNVALILDIGVFFMISCECMMQLSIPAYKPSDALLKNDIL